jgi:hypothetical protein
MKHLIKTSWTVGLSNVFCHTFGMIVVCRGQNVLHGCRNLRLEMLQNLIGLHMPTTFYHNKLYNKSTCEVSHILKYDTNEILEIF